MKVRQLVCLILIVQASLFACKQAGDAIDPAGDGYEWALPAGFPVPDVPTENQLTKSRVELGRQLFYEKALSRDFSLSCASCHVQEKAFADSKAISPGFEGELGFRNAPTLANVAYHPYFFAEGGNPSLERQVLGPIDNETELGFNSAELAERLPSLTQYHDLSQKAYGRNLDLFVVTRAIASFERTLISGNSAYDKYTFQQQPNALTAEEKMGMDLFFSDQMGCATCHSGFNFTNYSFQNNGLYKEVIDRGRANITQRIEDEGKFKVPSLRNIAMTAPYMHDGSLSTLEEVINHYELGGQNHPYQHEAIRPLSITQSEKVALIAFLRSLTDHTFIQDPAFNEE